MELIYKIEFNSTSFYYKSIIEDIAKQTSINVDIKMYKGFILLICNDEAQNIEEFFKLLEQKLPLSLFLGKAEVIEEFDFEANIELEDKNENQNFELLTNDRIKELLEEDLSSYETLAKNILEGQSISLDTSNGSKEIFLENKITREDFDNKQKEIKLLITNINEIQNLVDISQKDLQLLCSIERPLVKLKFKLLKNMEGEFSSTRFIYAKLADDKNTFLLAQALKEKGINQVLYINKEEGKDDLKVTYNEKQNIIINANKSFFPKYDYELEKTIASSKEYFDSYGSIFKTILAKENKRTVPSVAAYFSLKSSDSGIKVNIPTLGQRDVIYVPNVQSCIENALEDIRTIDENTYRLVDNYKKKFSKYFEKKYTKKDTKGFETIFDLCAYVLGLKDSKALEDLALMFGGKSGLQIDMNVVKIDSKNYLDYRRVIQSLMSYKMADVDNTLLAYSVYESLSDLISNNINEISQETKAKDVVLCGDMFSNSILSSKVYKSLNNYNIILPSSYPIDL